MWFSDTELKEAAHPLVLQVLEIERPRHGSLRNAQKFVAEKMGGSARWLRRIIGRCPHAVLQSHQMLNLVMLYRERKGDSGPIKALWRKVIQRRKRTNASAGHPAEASRVRPWKLGGIGSRNTCSEASAVPGHVDNGSGLPRP